MATTNALDSRQDLEEMGAQCEEQAEDFATLVTEVSDSVQRYCSQRPGVVAGVLFGLGFFCGWKLRPW